MRRIWFSDWGANQVIALDADGSHEVVVTVQSFPMYIDFLPYGRLRTSAPSAASGYARR